MALGADLVIDVAMSGEVHAFIPFRWSKFWMAVTLMTSSLSAQTDPLADARDQLRRGRYEDVARVAHEAHPESRQDQEAWLELEARALLDLGRYAEAEKRLSEVGGVALINVPLRLLAREAAQNLGKPAGATLMVQEVVQAMRYTVAVRGNEYARSSEFQAAAGEASLLAGLDPRLALENFLKPAQSGKPPSRNAFLVAGKLALEKRDYALAARTFRNGLQIAPTDPDLLCGLATSFRNGDRKELVTYAQQALEINPRHVPSHLLLAEHFIDAERRDTAAVHLDLALSVNPHTPEAHALRAVLAHLAHDTAAESRHRTAALELWPNNPRVDHLIGRKLSQQYQFADGAAAQRRALEMDSTYTPARVQLAQDLLRLAQEDEGWSIATQAHTEDAYNIEAFNLTTLHDELAGFTVVNSPHFRVRMAANEAPIYGDRVVALLERAHQHLSTRYGLKLDQPTLVEIYPNPKDFAVRTFGVPDIGGFLGVCFGPVFTINSPASSQANWEAVLWHEFTHVITLTLTRNQMPRWLSEGISVFEERQANPSWGQLMSVNYRERIMQGRVQPISRMSSAFLEAQDGRDTQFAYFQSAMVVEFLVERYGFDRLRTFLRSLAGGQEINAALSANFSPVAELDRAFAAKARETAAAFGSGFDFRASSDGLIQLLAQNLPGLGGAPNVPAVIKQAREALEHREWAEARSLLTPLVEAGLYLPGNDNLHALLARACAGAGDVAAETAALRTIAAHESDSLSAVSRLLEVERTANNWSGVAQWANAWLAINPLAPSPWRALLDAGEHAEDHASAAHAGEILLRLDPPDIAAVHLRVAQQLQSTDANRARRHALQALEEAPRFRAAYEVLAALPPAPTPNP
ncbi:MAG: tetratricopeptide repeat protein [Opitutus sp.]